MECVGANEPLYLPMPRNLCTTTYGAMTISGNLEPQSVPSSEMQVPHSKFWSLKDIVHEPKQAMNCLIPALADLCEQEAVENKGNETGDETVLGWVNLILQPLSKVVAEMSLASARNPSRWWTTSRNPSTCSLTGFPIHLLPYPPFKLRVHAAKPWPHVWVDGKVLAWHLIAFDSLVQTVVGRPLVPQEVAALAQHMCRFKLGRVPLEVTRVLAKKSTCPNLSQSERADAERELSKLRAAAKRELKRLRRIQEQRLDELQRFEPGLQSANKSLKTSKQRDESEASTCSGMGNVESDEYYERYQ